jgi:hypothetical protein
MWWHCNPLCDSSSLLWHNARNPHPFYFRGNERRRSDSARVRRGNNNLRSGHAVSLNHNSSERSDVRKVYIQHNRMWLVSTHNLWSAGGRAGDRHTQFKSLEAAEKLHQSFSLPNPDVSTAKPSVSALMMQTGNQPGPSSKIFSDTS